jgi:hypothetical protein
MKTFKQFRLELNEARKNPELNPKISAYEALLPYKYDDNAYIHFSDLNKLGMNPLSDFQTPYGIFAYPLKEIWKEYDVDKLKTFKKVPFASNRKYIHLFKWNGKGKNINDLYRDFTSADYDRDIVKLKTIFEKKIDKTKTQTIFNKILKLVVKYKLKVPDDFELGKPVNVGGFVGRTVDQFSLEYNVIMKELLPLQNEYNNTLIDFDIVIVNATKASRIKSPAGCWWNCLRWLSNFGVDPAVKTFFNELLLVNYEHENKKVYNGPLHLMTYKDFPIVDSKTIYDGSRNWLHLLRELGYSGVSDKSGHGIIHPAEPIQSVFFGMEFIEKIDMILNKDYLGTFSVTGEKARTFVKDWVTKGNNKDIVNVYIRSHLIDDDFAKLIYSLIIKKEFSSLEDIRDEIQSRPEYYDMTTTHGLKNLDELISFYKI